MREKNDDDICFPGDKIPYRPASRNIIVYKNPCLDKRGERKETDGTIFRRIVTGVSLFVMGYARMFPVNMKSFHEEKGHQVSEFLFHIVTLLNVMFSYQFFHKRFRLAITVEQ